MTNNDWGEAFLTALRNSGNVRAACQAAGITRPTAYNLRKKSKAFLREWEIAMAEATDVLAAEARRRALAQSDTLLIYLLKVHGGPEYRNDQRQRVDVRFEIEQSVRKLAQQNGLSEDEIAAAIAEAERLVSG